MIDQDSLEELLSNNEKEGRHFNNLKLKEIKEFIIQSLLKYGTIRKLTISNKVNDVLIGMLKSKNQITQHGGQTFVEVLIAASFVHNLFFDGTISSLFKARENLLEIANKCDLPENGRDAIFQTVEAQLGDSMPVLGCRPTPNSPTELFSWAVWFVKEYLADDINI